MKHGVRDEKKGNKLKDSSPYTLLFHSLLWVVRVMGIFLFKDKAYGPEVILQSLIVTVHFDIKLHQPPHFFYRRIRVPAIDFRGTDGEVNIPAGQVC